MVKTVKKHTVLIYTGSEEGNSIRVRCYLNFIHKDSCYILSRLEAKTAQARHGLLQTSWDVVDICNGRSKAICIIDNIYGAYADCVGVGRDGCIGCHFICWYSFTVGADRRTVGFDTHRVLVDAVHICWDCQRICQASWHVLLHRSLQLADACHIISDGVLVV